MPKENVADITSIATSKTKRFFTSRKKAFAATGLLIAGVALFAFGRKSKDVVKSVDLEFDIETPSK